jgi:hypothetical protein
MRTKSYNTEYRTTQVKQRGGVGAETPVGKETPGNVKLVNQWRVKA